MFCPQCGKKCPDDARFCENCGSSIAPASQPQSAPSFRQEPDALSATVSEIAENVQKAQIVPTPAAAPVYAAPRSAAQPVFQQAPVKKKSYTGLIVTLVVLLVLLAAAGGGAFYLFHTRSANEAELSANLMEYMWAYCEADVVEYYDDALAKPYSQRGYKIEQKDSSFKLLPAQEKDVFPVSGRVNIIDRTNDDASYRVDITGTVKTNFMRTQYTWDLEYDFEEPPAPEPGDEPAPLPDSQPAENGDVQTPAEPLPGDSPAAPGTAAPGTATTPGGASAPQDTYLWPTDSQYITNDDLDHFTRKEIMLMRNELYARYGCSFQDEEIRTYFEAQSWYDPDPDLLAIDFQRGWFNDYETANLDTILNYEKAMGWRK